MCACGKFPHDFRCPDAPEPEVIAECAVCGDSIRIGHKRFVIDETDVCFDCAENMSMDKLQEVFDLTSDEIFRKLGGMVRYD